MVHRGPLPGLMPAPLKNAMAWSMLVTLVTIGCVACMCACVCACTNLSGCECGIVMSVERG